MVLPLEPTDVPGIYQRGSRFVMVYRAGGRQRKQSVATLAEARALKLRRAGEARALRRGPTLHDLSLSWLDRYAGTGHDSVRENTRREYRRLLVNFALVYFDREVRVGDLDRAAVQHFVDWLTTRPGRDGRLCDRSIAKHSYAAAAGAGCCGRRGTAGRQPGDARRAAAAASGAGMVGARAPLPHPGRTRAPARRGPVEVAPLVRAARRQRAADLRGDRPALGRPRARRPDTTPARQARGRQGRGRRAEVTPRRATDPADRRAGGDAARPPALRRRGRRLRVPGRDGGLSDQGSLRRRILLPAAARAGLTGVGFHTLRHTCASMLIEAGLSPLRLQRWMGHHSPTFTLETYGHLIDGDLGPPLDLRIELRAPTGPRETTSSV